MMMNGSVGRSGGWRKAGAAFALAACAVASSSAPAAALDQRCLEDATRVRVSEKLVARAENLAGKGTSWALAGEFMVQAAELRPECAPERLTALRTAARYFAFAGQFGKASDASYRAGESCVWNGHVTAAADAFIDAATYALEVGDEVRVRTAAGHASRLADSPLLTHVQRIAIQGRADRILERSGLASHPSDDDRRSGDWQASA